MDLNGAPIGNNGLLATADKTLLEIYAKTYSRWRAASDKVDQYGDVLLLGQNKHPQVSPWYSAMNRYAEDCRKMLVEMGLSPAARARMRVSVDQKRAGKWEGILKVVG